MTEAMKSYVARAYFDVRSMLHGIERRTAENIAANIANPCPIGVKVRKPMASKIPHQTAVRM